MRLVVKDGLFFVALFRKMTTIEGVQSITIVEFIMRSCHHKKNCSVSAVIEFLFHEWNRMSPTGFRVQRIDGYQSREFQEPSSSILASNISNIGESLFVQKCLVCLLSFHWRRGDKDFEDVIGDDCIFAGSRFWNEEDVNLSASKSAESGYVESFVSLRRPACSLYSHLRRVFIVTVLIIQRQGNELRRAWLHTYFKWEPYSFSRVWRAASIRLEERWIDLPNAHLL